MCSVFVKRQVKSSFLFPCIHSAREVFNVRQLPSEILVKQQTNIPMIQYG